VPYTRPDLQAGTFSNGLQQLCLHKASTVLGLAHGSLLRDQQVHYDLHIKIQVRTASSLTPTCVNEARQYSVPRSHDVHASVASVLSQLYDHNTASDTDCARRKRWSTLEETMRSYHTGDHRLGKSLAVNDIDMLHWPHIHSQCVRIPRVITSGCTANMLMRIQTIFAERLHMSTW
jgi:hypothetical protein